MYLLKNDRFEHKAGSRVYPCYVHDYGLARDEELMTGEPHMSVTLDEKGGYPFFTVPVKDLN